MGFVAGLIVGILLVASAILAFIVVGGSKKKSSNNGYNREFPGDFPSATYDVEGLDEEDMEWMGKHFK